MLFFSGKLEIGAIEINGTETIDPDKIKDLVRNEIDRKYLNIVQKNNLILARSSKIESRIKNEFKKIENVEIRRKFPSSLLISIKERKSALVFCSGENCFIVDDKGIAYENADVSSEEFLNNGLILLKDNNGKSITPEENVLEESYINYVSSISGKLKNELDINITREMETPTKVSADIKTMADEGWAIFFSTDIELEKETEMLKVVLENKIEKEKRKDLEYVDLRSDNKVFYKFKEGVQEETNVETSDQNAKTESKDEKKDDSKKKKKN